MKFEELKDTNIVELKHKSFNMYYTVYLHVM